MLERNLRALKLLREGPAPSVTIGSAGQVNLAAQQTNSVQADAAAGVVSEIAPPDSEAPSIPSGSMNGRSPSRRTRAAARTRRSKAV